MCCRAASIPEAQDISRSSSNASSFTSVVEENEGEEDYDTGQVGGDPQRHHNIKTHPLSSKLKYSGKVFILSSVVSFLETSEEKPPLYSIHAYAGFLQVFAAWLPYMFAFNKLEPALFPMPEFPQIRVRQKWDWVERLQIIVISCLRPTGEHILCYTTQERFICVLQCVGGKFLR